MVDNYWKLVWAEEALPTSLGLCLILVRFNPHV